MYLRGTCAYIVGCFVCWIRFGDFDIDKDELRVPEITKNVASKGFQNYVNEFVVNLREIPKGTPRTDRASMVVLSC